MASSYSARAGFSKRNVFDLTHERKMTLRMGKLVPCLCMEVLPGDVVKMSSDLVMRLMPLVAPMMHRVDTFVHFFFVPTRLLQKNWDVFLTGGKTGNTVIPAPVIEVTNQSAPGSLHDYLGVPSPTNGTVWSPAIQVSALPFRAYAMIYNEWYRDQNLIDEVPVSDGDGLDTVTSTDLLTRAWQKGYFESALPFAQRGDPISVPLAGDAVVKTNGQNTKFVRGAYSTGNPYAVAHMQSGLSNNSFATVTGVDDQTTPLDGVDTNLRADLSTASSITINDLRLSFQIQRFLEKNARAGVRYIEFLAAHFGVKSSDARLQRPEYLGGGRSPIVVGNVFQTSSTDATSPQANPAGTGFSSQRTLGFRRQFEEYGYVVGLVSVMPKPAYQQGLHRMWSRFTRYDQYLPVLAHLGEQAVLNKELCIDVDQQNIMDDVFGYQARYQEFRELPTTVHGQFRSSLDFWHMGRIFDETPVLNDDFVNCDPTKRVFAVVDPAEHEVVLQMLHHIRAVRPLPKYGDPGLIDHN